MKKSILILFSFIAICCSKNEVVQTTPSQTPTIIGNWTWIESKGGIAPITYTPASTGKIIILTITANEVIEKTNGVITNTWAYSINTQNSIFGGSRQMLIFSTRVNQSYEIIGNQLLLNDECFDCLSNKFSRI